MNLEGSHSVNLQIHFAFGTCIVEFTIFLNVRIVFNMTLTVTYCLGFHFLGFCFSSCYICRRIVENKNAVNASRTTTVQLSAKIIDGVHSHPSCTWCPIKVLLFMKSPKNSEPITRSAKSWKIILSLIYSTKNEN